MEEKGEWLEQQNNAAEEKTRSEEGGIDVTVYEEQEGEGVWDRSILPEEARQESFLQLPGLEDTMNTSVWGAVAEVDTRSFLAMELQLEVMHSRVVVSQTATRESLVVLKNCYDMAKFKPQKYRPVYFVTEPAFDRISTFSHDFKFVGTFNKAGKSAEVFSAPRDILATSNGFLAITDKKKLRCSFFNSLSVNFN